MSSEKRIILCTVLSVLSVVGLQYAMERAGWIVPPKPRPVPPAVAKLDPKAVVKPADPDAGATKPELPAHPFAPEGEAVAVKPAEKAGPKLAKPEELVLGPASADPKSPYNLRLQLSQRGAAVETASSMRYDAEFEPDDRGKPARRLDLIATDRKSAAPGSLAITMASAARTAPAGDEADVAEVEAALDLNDWEVVRDRDDAPAVREIARSGKDGAKVEGQEIAFRARPAKLPVVVTKTYRLWRGEDGFDVDLRFAPVDGKEARFTYRLYGPHGIPIEGDWYTSTFRDVFFGQLNGNATDITTRPASEVVKSLTDPTQRVAALPLKFAGVENQYFATLVEPWPIPRTQDDRRDLDAGAVLIRSDPIAPQKADVGVEIVSKPVLVGPNLPEVVHGYRVFAGPKSTAALTPFEAEDLASYRKYQWFTIPFASTLARNVIAPMLEHIYAFTAAVAGIFGGSRGNYGISIILLTMCVRLAMFPIGRKQAMMAKKMQDLQPVLAEVKEKYKDDKEALTRETMAVWKRHKVNPAAGCLPALIQMPIFVGLWQSLNNSVALRHSSFLYIRDLAAPDMLFKFPFELPLIGGFLGPYFNVLPIVVVALMMVQTKLFSPPPTTPEAEMNQKMMKYMMVFMAVMFYKVPSGLGLYFITSSLWQIGERLLLPKITAKHAAKPAAEDDDFGDKGRGRGPSGGGGPKGNDSPGGNGNGNGNGNGVQGWLGKKLEKLLEEAAKDKTIRNDDRGAERGRGPGRDADRSRPRSKPPGKRR